MKPPRAAPDSRRIDVIQNHLKLPRPIAALLAARGVGYAEGGDLLEWESDRLRGQLAPPASLPGLDVAVELLAGARERGEAVVVHGDYDVDGMAGTALLWMALRRAGFETAWTLPLRESEGYGLTPASLDRCLAGEGVRSDRPLRSPVKWVVSVDTGISAGPAVAHARKRGLRTIITDHHIVGPDWPDAAEVVVHPRHPNSTNPHLCGCAVAWKLACRLLERCGPEQADPARLLQLVALATLADMVPMTPENRALVRLGLHELDTRPLPGLRALRNAAGFLPEHRLRSKDIGFRLGPRLNAAGRLRQGEVAIELLVAGQLFQAETWANRLEELNRQRQEIDHAITREALAAASALGLQEALVLHADHWHEGVSGIVAARVAETHHRAAIVLAPDPGRPDMLRGSCRSGGRTDVHGLLERCADLLPRWGGHTHAGGFSMKAVDLPELRRRMALAQAEPALSLSGAGGYADLEVRLHEIDAVMVGELARLEPWGPGWETPIFWAREVALEKASRVGQGRHLRAQAEQDGVRLPAIGFGQGDWAPRLGAVERRDIAFVPEWNDFRGHRTLQVQLKDIA